MGLMILRKEKGPFLINFHPGFRKTHQATNERTKNSHDSFPSPILIDAYRPYFLYYIPTFLLPDHHHHPPPPPPPPPPSSQLVSKLENKKQPHIYLTYVVSALSVKFYLKITFVFFILSVRSIFIRWLKGVAYLLNSTLKNTSRRKQFEKKNDA